MCFLNLNKNPDIAGYYVFVVLFQPTCMERQFNIHVYSNTYNYL